MKNNIIAKTLLTTYKYLETFASSVDKHINKRAEMSFFVSSNCENSVMDVTDKIIELSERKVNYINFKILIENYILTLTESQAEVVIERYIEGQESQAIANNLNIPIRTYYRKIEGAEGKLLPYFSENGYSEKRLLDIIQKDPLFYTAYQGINISGTLDERRLQHAL